MSSTTGLSKRATQIVRLEMKANSLNVNFSDAAVAEAILNQVSFCTFCYVEAEAVVFVSKVFCFCLHSSKTSCQGSSFGGRSSQMGRFSRKRKKMMMNENSCYDVTSVKCKMHLK